MNLGRSFIDFGSTATVTTGSDMCLIASNGGILLLSYGDTCRGTSDSSDCEYSQM